MWNIAIGFLGLPGQTWMSVGGALLLGIVILAVATLTKRRATGASLPEFWRDVARDIGIAFVVASVVSAVYEYSTRSIAERETLLDTLNRAMKAFVQGNVWDEVRNQILRRNAIRRNVQLDLKIVHEIEDASGKRITLAPNQAVLWMSYRYDLYGIAAAESKIPVRHELAFEMWNPTLHLPRFERVVVDGPGPNARRVYEGKALSAICDDHGVVRLDGAHIVTLPPPSLGQPVRITTERYELINVPGAYDLIMPELTARAEGSSDPTIRITFVGPVPEDIVPNVDTYYPPHSFTRPDRKKYEWLYSGILLPGQGLTLVFRRPSDSVAVSRTLGKT